MRSLSYSFIVLLFVLSITVVTKVAGEVVPAASDAGILASVWGLISGIFSALWSTITSYPKLMGGVALAAIASITLVYYFPNWTKPVFSYISRPFAKFWSYVRGYIPGMSTKHCSHPSRINLKSLILPIAFLCFCGIIVGTAYQAKEAFISQPPPSANSSGNSASISGGCCGEHNKSTTANGPASTTLSSNEPGLSKVSAPSSAYDQSLYTTAFSVVMASLVVLLL